ncbi:DUF6445 family protein, partial [Escherichia coli]|nr:DUF6445 family protein [Escherichia coli]
ARGPGYGATLQRELAGYTPPPAYIDGATRRCSNRSAAIEARPNRAVVYRSALLHSGRIPPAATLSDNPPRGRLTVTAFLRAVPA